MIISLMMWFCMNAPRQISNGTLRPNVNLQLIEPPLSSSELSKFPILFHDPEALSQYGYIKGLPGSGEIACETVIKSLHCVNSSGESFTLPFRMENVIYDNRH